MDDISFSKRRKNRGYTYLCTGSVICVSLLRAPQYSTFACCLIPVLTLVELLVMLDDIDGIFFSKRRYFLIVSWMSISVYCTPTRDTHITRDMCMGIHITRGYTYHCDTGNLGIIFNILRVIPSTLRVNRVGWPYVLLWLVLGQRSIIEDGYIMYGNILYLPERDRCCRVLSTGVMFALFLLFLLIAETSWTAGKYLILESFLLQYRWITGL